MSSSPMNMMKLPAIHARPAKHDPYLPVSAAAEFLGPLILQLGAGAVGDSPAETALLFTAILFAIKYVSGGHINPVSSFAALMSGHIDYVRGLVYILCQFLGAMMGALLQAWLSPFSKVGKKDPSCHMPMGDLEDSNGRVFMWEMLLTLLFVQVMYASVFVRPGHGDIASLAPGLALYAALSTGGQFTGGSPLDIARLFATSVVFKCSWRWTGIFLSAHLTAGLLAAGWTLWAFGKGDHFKQTDRTSQLRESLLRGGVEAPASMEGQGYAGASATIPP